ncbi:MAG: HlyD family efflux transporter periplasmic adaptor subunit [Acidobacteria bacterium]|nr:HlyD family efflux transporter periplasmic adaptor subunit [Acidobacteriota bacterium]
MDIQRSKSVARNRQLRHVALAFVVLCAVVGVSLWVSRLKPAAPTVDRATVWIDTVKRGPMLRQVRGLGTLVPEEIRWIPAGSQGKVENILVKPGAEVKADTILMELSNPELEQSVLDAGLQLKAAEAEYASLKVRLESTLLDQQAAASSVKSDFIQAKMRSDSDEQLAKDGLISDLNRKLSRVTADQLKTRTEIEQKRLAIHDDSVKAQLGAQQARIEQLKALADLRKSQLADLKVKAGMSGVVQLIPVQVGQQVTPGTNLARIADPTRLKAEIRIAETQAKDVLVGQLTTVDTRNGTVNGKVVRIDPSVQNGTVTVDVSLEGELPKGARPDLSVDGTVELERLDDVVFVGRPVQGQPNSTIGIFKIESDGKHAVRVPVKLGRSSVNTIEVVEGLKPGEQVILSDMSAWDAVDRIQLN